MMDADPPKYIHHQLGLELERKITEDQFSKLKRLAKGLCDFGDGEMEKAKEFSKLFELMDDKGFISVGNYEPLKKLVTDAGKLVLVNDIEQAENKIYNYWAHKAAVGAPQQANQESLNQMYA